MGGVAGVEEWDGGVQEQNNQEIREGRDHEINRSSHLFYFINLLLLSQYKNMNYEINIFTYYSSE